MEEVYYISSEIVDFKTVKNIIDNQLKIALSQEAINNISKCRSYLDAKLEKEDHPIYGINTGFGALYNVKISSLE